MPNPVHAVVSSARPFAPSSPNPSPEHHTSGISASPSRIESLNTSSEGIKGFCQWLSDTIGAIVKWISAWFSPEKVEAESSEQLLQAQRGQMIQRGSQKIEDQYNTLVREQRYSDRAVVVLVIKYEGGARLIDQKVDEPRTTFILRANDALRELIADPAHPSDRIGKLDITTKLFEKVLDSRTSFAPKFNCRYLSYTPSTRWVSGSGTSLFTGLEDLKGNIDSTIPAQFAQERERLYQLILNF
jgi:hypothetical protein